MESKHEIDLTVYFLGKDLGEWLADAFKSTFLEDDLPTLAQELSKLPPDQLIRTLRFASIVCQLCKAGPVVIEQQ